VENGAVDLLFGRIHRLGEVRSVVLALQDPGREGYGQGVERIAQDGEKAAENGRQVL